MEYVKEILKGVLIGVANIIPGVSGGTLAVSMGIYDKIIRSVTHILKDTRQSIRTLLPYGIGAGIGLVGLSFMIEFLFGQYPLQTSMAFIGLITGGIPVLTRKMKHHKMNTPGYLVFAVTFVIVAGMALLEGNGDRIVDLSPGILQSIALFGVGMVAAATMVIPGISGSMLLMMLGYYQPIIASINRFIVSVVTVDFGGAFLECAILAPFGLGVLAGIFAFAKLIELLLDKYELLTYCAIMGLVISSPVVILAGVPLPGIHMFGIVSGLVCFGLSYAGAALLGKGGTA